MFKLDFFYNLLNKISGSKNVYSISPLGKVTSPQFVNGHEPCDSKNKIKGNFKSKMLLGKMKPFFIIIIQRYTKKLSWID